MLTIIGGKCSATSKAYCDKIISTCHALRSLFCPKYLYILKFENLNREKFGITLAKQSFKNSLQLFIRWLELGTFVEIIMYGAPKYLLCWMQRTSRPRGAPIGSIRYVNLQTFSLRNLHRVSWHRGHKAGVRRVAHCPHFFINILTFPLLFGRRSYFTKSCQSHCTLCFNLIYFSRQSTLGSVHPSMGAFFCQYNSYD